MDDSARAASPRLFTLSPRLELLAAWVPEGTRFADIGSDHAYLPIRLLRDGRVAYAIASDISLPCVRRAERNAAFWDVPLDVRQGNGLSAVAPDEADTLVLAGMGGETIADILGRAPYALEKRLLLQPSSRPEALRRFLYAQGRGIADERVVAEPFAGRRPRLYTALLVDPALSAPPPDGDPLHDYASPALLGHPDAAARDFLRRTVDELKRERRRASEDEAAHTSLIARLSALLEVS